MINLPDFELLKISQLSGIPTRKIYDALDHVLIILPSDPPETLFRRLPQGTQLRRLLKKTRNTKAPSATSRLNNSKATGVTVATLDGATTAFNQLTWARKIITRCTQDQPGNLGILVLGLEEEKRQSTLENLVAAAEAAAFQLPTFKSVKKTKAPLERIKILASKPRVNLNTIRAQALGNNIARWFTALPPNKLDAKNYRKLVKALCARYGIQATVLDESKLERLGANAFLAVSQGNANRDAGIIQLRYRPPGIKYPGLMLVGKGILFDTGGTNLKPFKNMLDMHMDMEGSAVALGALIALATLEVPYGIDAWLAVTENRLSATAYKSQDIIQAANGTTIQIIHTDAEGRMVLADTLALAAREKPDVIIDYATLTGTCVSALTERYSGVFSNRIKANALLYHAGVSAGERVWPFPMDEDYDEMLHSEVADIKQCSEAGYGDHILAARFLSKFVPKDIPWIHIDLSAGQHKSGLAHIPSDITGFGVKLTLELLSERGPTALAKELS